MSRGGPRAPGVAAVVLAAGPSTRMGRPKLLLEKDGEPLVKRAVRSCGEARLEPVIAVLGHHAPELAATLNDLKCRAVVNPDYRSGIASSIATGVREIPAGPAGVILTLSDMPFVTAEMLSTLAEHARSGDFRLVRSNYGGAIAPPTFFHRDLFQKLLSLKGDDGARSVRPGSEGGVSEMVWPPDRIRDVDRPEDCRLLKLDC